MKVVYVTMFAQAMGGGAGRVASEITQVFSKNDQAILVRPGLKTKIIKENNILVLEVKSKGQGDIMIPVINIKEVGLVFRYLSEFSPDVIHAHDPGPISYFVQFWANKHKIPFIYTSHILPTKIASFETKEVAKIIGNLLNSKIVKSYLLAFLKNCEAIIALNESGKNDIRKLGFKGTLTIIPNGRDLNKYKKDFEIKIERKNLLNIGYLTEWKNQKYLLEVMKYLPSDYTLNLIGSAIDKKYYQSLVDYIKRNKLTNVNLLGKIEHENIPWHLQKAGLFVSSSKMEVQSLVIIEALASGTPVVSLENETTVDMIDETCGKRLPKKTDPKKFAEEIIKICSLPRVEYLKICQQSIDKVGIFDWKKVKKQTKDLYSEQIKMQNSITKDKKEVKKSKQFDIKLSSLFTKLNKGIKLEGIDLLKKIKIINSNYAYLLVLIIITYAAGSYFSLVSNVEELKNRISLK